MNLAILILKTEASEMQEVEASECLEDDASEMQEVEASESHTPYVTDEYPEPLDLHQPSHFPIASTNLVAQVLKEHMQFDATQLLSFAPYDPGPLESPFVTIIETLPRQFIELLYVDEYPNYVALKYDAELLKSTLSSYKDAYLRNCLCLVLFCENSTARCFHLDQIGHFQHSKGVQSGYVSYMLVSINGGEDSLDLHPSLPLGCKDFTTLYANEIGIMGGYTIRALKFLVLWLIDKSMWWLFVLIILNYCYETLSNTGYSSANGDTNPGFPRTIRCSTVMDDFFDVGSSQEEQENLIQLVEKWDVDVNTVCCSEAAKIIFSAFAYHNL
ncbi:ent-kaurene synthase [Trifolium repens]|nr:ent-kaurene synthase [Trifolium repens]